MSTTIPALDPVTDILDTDKIMVTQSSGQTYTMSGANFNKRNQAVIASSTTLTGAPLKTGNIVRAYFTANINGVNTSTGLVLNYNGSNKNVKVPKDGALVNFTAQNLGGSPTVYRYLQAYTMLELLYDGTNFVIIGNPVVISSADYTIYADGLRRVDAVLNNNKNMVTSDAVYQNILYKLPFNPRSDLTDCNTADNGLFCALNVSNAPADTNQYIYLLTMKFNNDSNYVIQFCVIISSVTIYRRVKINGIWSQWYSL